jgi:hypothetical protein
VIIDEEKFIKSIDSQFWKKATSNVAFKDVIHYQDINRTSFLKSLCRQINEYEHNFSKPNYYYFPKSQGVLRKVKSYSIADIVIYYFCVKLLQDKLYEKISQNEKIFGGFKFTAANKSTVEVADSDVIYPIEYESFLSKDSFKMEWKEFQKLAKEAVDKRYDKYVHVDIAHFYDDINLDILEREIRNIVNGESNVIELLFHFLRYSDKRDLSYSPNNVGIPQEEIGDMSRVLANFYLSSFDTVILKYLSDNFSANDYTFMRYSDDMWFCFNGDNDDAFKLIQQISLSLEKIKLHINEKKTCIYNRRDFIKHWHFNKWKQIQKRWSDRSFIKDNFEKLINGQQNGRWSSLSSYLLKIITSSSSKYIPLYNYSDSHQLILNLLDNPVLVERLEMKHMIFFVKLLRKHNNLVGILQDYLTGKKNMYPNVEYFILKLLSLLPINSSINVIDFMCEFYLTTAITKDSHWYSRAICIRFFMRSPCILYFTTTNKRLFGKILNQMQNCSDIENQNERRYIIYFLLRHGKIKGKKVLKKYFFSPKDLSYIKYLERVDYV